MTRRRGAPSSFLCRAAAAAAAQQQQQHRPFLFRKKEVFSVLSITLDYLWYWNEKRAQRDREKKSSSAIQTIPVRVSWRTGTKPAVAFISCLLSTPTKLTLFWFCFFICTFSPLLFCIFLGMDTISSLSLFVYDAQSLGFSGQYRITQVLSISRQASSRKRLPDSSAFEFNLDE